jgi:hypothetical protein
VQPALDHGARDLGMGDDRRRDVHRLEPREREQLVEIRRPELELRLLGELARALGLSRPDRDRLELVELGQHWERDLRAVAAADHRDLHGIAHGRSYYPLAAAS